MTTDPAVPGDFILCHKHGLVPAIIRAGQTVRARPGARWSHAAFVVAPGTIVEALTRQVVRSPLTKYDHVEHRIVHTHLDPVDVRQAVAFAESCVGQSYGFLTILGIALRFLTPGRGLWFGANGTEICSGLVAQALCRGWANFSVNPASCSPAELGEAYPG